MTYAEFYSPDNSNHIKSITKIMIINHSKGSLTQSIGSRDAIVYYLFATINDNRFIFLLACLRQLDLTLSRLGESCLLFCSFFSKSSFSKG